MIDFKKLTEPLKPSEIELRIGSISENKGFSLLAYKTARTDRNRLDDVVGCMDWQNKHYVDAHNNVICQIGIWDENKKQWIWKEDTGSESFTEKEKGSYSDSFKRAGFRWGIGIELYDYPFIWVDWTKGQWEERRGKKIPKTKIGEWTIIYEGQTFKDGIKITDKFGNVMWSTKSPNTKVNVELVNLEKNITKAFKELKYTKDQIEATREEYLEGKAPDVLTLGTLLKDLRNEWRNKNE